MQTVGGKLWGYVEKAAYLVLGGLFKIAGKELPEQAFAAFMQFVKFGVVGVSNTVISYLLYVAGLLTFQKFHILPGQDYLLAQLLAFVLSVLWSFYWNNKMVFKAEEGKERSLGKALIKTYISYSFTGLFLNSILLMLWVQVFHISEYIAPVINLLVSVPVNFLINKFWAFRE